MAWEEYDPNKKQPEKREIPTGILIFMIACLAVGFLILACNVR